MRGTVSRDMVLQDVFVPDDGEVLPPGLFGAMYNAFPQLSPLTFCATFLGLMQAAYDGALAYLTGQMAGSPGLHTEAAVKGHAVAEMLFTLEGARALYYRAISEARVDCPPDAVQRARAAHVTVQRSAVTVTQEAIRVCGGRGPAQALSARALRARRARRRADAPVDAGDRHPAGVGSRARPGGAGHAKGAAALAVTPFEIGAADRIRTGDVQLGKLAFCH